ncbi:hypothetical protein AUC68_02925 [Methyloceanibacter methanicus]|uniref:DNA gyrase inhibitor YacG n=1 Tax=Methyloceanibacter methanicus TaxID=1774968 RepID=A0A1E3W2Q0_9HYPH|nr:DNA gyrase inhibitor YacG [Methyloceanibacter methanicus]ODS00089.1 hypothetical protein AUC68_02925 [Methyloceanibacter methanicus]
MSTGGEGSPAPKAISRCPICRKPSVEAHRPFCSKRCAEIDLGRWLKGGYAVPGEPAGEGHPEPPADWENE